MSLQPDGKAFVDLVATTVGRELSYGKFLGMLYEHCSRSGKLSLFSDLAFVAKSFQKLKRLLEDGVSDETSKAKISHEAQDALQRFLSMLAEASDDLPGNEKEVFNREFLVRSQDSFERALGLLDDFSIVKDFFLSQRDREKRS